MNRENFYLAYYQAILDRNLTKLVKLENLTNEERINYPEEYPHLSYNEIFQANDPIDFINTLLRTAEFENFYLMLYDAINSLATLENIAIREKSSIELMQYPLIDYCPADRSSTINNLLLVIYSKVITKDNVINKFIVPRTFIELHS